MGRDTMKKIAIFLIVLFFLPFTSFAAEKYIDNGDGTITDTSTTLMWQKSFGQGSWDTANSYCNQAGTGGYSDWRLPSLTELQLLVDPAYEPTIDPIFACATAYTSYYWTSSVEGDSAWTVRFYAGGAHLIVKSNPNIYVRCVRGGPSLPPTVITSPATSVTSSSATMTGTVNPNGLSSAYHFQYGATTSYGSTTSSSSAGSGTSAVSVSATIISLAENTVYHYRLVATNSIGASYGTDKTFGTAIIRVDPTCYSTVGEAIANAPSVATIRITEGDYDESVTLSSSKELTLEGGWDLAFTSRSSTSTINSITIKDGTITTGYIVVE